MLARNVRVEIAREVSESAVLLDLDHTRAPKRWKIIERLHAAGYQLKSWDFEKSRRHWHAVLEVRPRPRSIYERIALQLLLGSDPAREANNLRRAMGLTGMPRGLRSTLNVLYEGDHRP